MTPIPNWSHTTPRPCVCSANLPGEQCPSHPDTRVVGVAEPTSAAVAVGKLNGKTAVALRVSENGLQWVVKLPNGGFVWRGWSDLCDELTDIRVEYLAEPGPWLRGDELEAVMPALKEHVVVEVEHDGHRATGELWAGDHGFLSLWAYTIRTTTGKPGPYIDSLRIIERAPEPEPGADIPDEVVKAAVNEWRQVVGTDREAMRAALAAADAKRAELEGRA